MSDEWKRDIDWTFHPDNPVIVPGRLNPGFDDDRAGAGHVVRQGDEYRLFYWGSGPKGNVVCTAVAPVDDPNAWRGTGCVLEPQPETDHNCNGPAFPFVFPIEGDRWGMIVGVWGKPREDGKLPNTTCEAVSDDGGRTWRYHGDRPVIAADRPWDCSGSGSVCVVRVDDVFRMYYTAIGEYSQKPDGVETGHGDVIPRIGVGYAESRDGLAWEKPLDRLVVEPRGFDTEPYEYISSKPFVLRDGDGWRMFVSTFGTAYRIRMLRSADGLDWEWVPDGGGDGAFGTGAPGAFDERQRCYACCVRHEDEYRLWYTADGFGATGMGYATGRAT